jgi:hypothetical protein
MNTERQVYISPLLFKRDLLHIDGMTKRISCVTLRAISETLLTHSATTTCPSKAKRGAYNDKK